jgi:cell wall-associated NlpC family hydrolase
MTFQTPIDIATHVGLSYLGKWYSWGGDDPSGIDCSGLVIACLKASGQLPRKGDWTADMLMKDHGWPDAEPQVGCLIFWGSDLSKATHVEMVIAKIRSDNWTIGASGGGRNTRTQDDAIRHNAFVKIRPMRPLPIACKDPFAEWRE